MDGRKLFAWVALTMWQALWVPVAVVLAHVVATWGFDAYEHWPSLDRIMHVLGGIAIAFFFHTAARNASACGILGPYHRLTHAALVFSFTCTAAMFWEFFEFATDRYYGLNGQTDVHDTIMDMFFGTVGGLVFLAGQFVVWRGWLAGKKGAVAAAPR
jgi:hypothetical protein